MCGTVASVEDRGYVVDLGVKGVKAFLTEKDSEPCIKDGYSMYKHEIPFYQPRKCSNGRIPQQTLQMKKNPLNYCQSMLRKLFPGVVYFISYLIIQ